MSYGFFRRLKRTFRYPISTAYVIIGLIVAFFALFDGLSIYSHVMNSTSAEKKAQFYETMAVNIENPNKYRMSLSCFQTNEDVNIKIPNYSVCIEKGDGNVDLSIILQNKLEQKLTFQEGRLPNKSEIEKGEHVIAIGCGWLPNVAEDNNGKNVTINNVKYKVVGVIGVQGANTQDYELVTYFNCLEEKLKNKILASKEFDLQLDSESENTYVSYKEIKENLYKLDKSISVEGQIVENGIDVIQYALQSSSIIVVIAVYLFCIANCIIISEFWIEQRRHEVAVMKAFGRSNIAIIKTIFGEMLSNTILAGILCVILQVIASNVIGELLNISIRFSIRNLVVTVFFAVFTSLLVITIPVRKIIKLSPAQSLLK